MEKMGCLILFPRIFLIADVTASDRVVYPSEVSNTTYTNLFCFLVKAVRLRYFESCLVYIWCCLNLLLLHLPTLFRKTFTAIKKLTFTNVIVLEKLMHCSVRNQFTTYIGISSFSPIYDSEERWSDIIYCYHKYNMMHARFKVDFSQKR